MAHVLLVDDDPMQAAVYARLLGSRGYTSEIATGAAEAVRLIGIRPPQGILADLGLPDRGAVTLIRAVREGPLGAGPKIFVLANAFLEADALDAWDAGADQVVGRATYPPEQVLEFLIAEMGVGASATPVAPPPEEFARTEFVERARGHVERARAALDRLTGGQSPAENLDEFATCMRRLQAGQAFGMGTLAQVASVSEWLARALGAWPSSVGASSIRTLGQGVTALSRQLGAARAPARDVTKCRALALDDDPTSRVLVSQALRKVRVPCDACATGDEALAAAASTRYDLVISDVMMPGMDGFEFVRRLRAVPGHDRTPVVYVTALDGFDRTFQRDAHGGTDAITKPYLIMELAAKTVVHLVANA